MDGNLQPKNFLKRKKKNFANINLGGNIKFHFNLFRPKIEKNTLGGHN